MEEEWKEIKGFEGYEVSNLGRIKSRKRYKEGKILDCSFNGRGAPRIALFRGKGKPTKVLGVNKLVAEAFLESDPHNKQVCHKDTNLRNCRVDNLEWCNVPLKRHPNVHLGVYSRN